MIEGTGYRMPSVGEVVDFQSEFEQVRQDSFDYRAAVVRRDPLRNSPASD